MDERQKIDVADLEAWLTERFERERQALLDLVIGIVERLLAEQGKREREAVLDITGTALEKILADRRQEFMKEIADLWRAIARANGLIENLHRELLERERGANDIPPRLAN
jgi:hypothetical protein